MPNTDVAKPQSMDELPATVDRRAEKSLQGFSSTKADLMWNRWQASGDIGIKKQYDSLRTGYSPMTKT